jgi:hypothetical protein
MSEYDFAYFSGKGVEYPTKPKKPILGSNVSPATAREFADNLEKYEIEIAEYEEKLKSCRAFIDERLSEFQETLKKDYGLADNEFWVIWGDAYERGHSGGLYEVFYEFDHLFDFLQRYKDAVKKT